MTATLNKLEEAKSETLVGEGSGMPLREEIRSLVEKTNVGMLVDLTEINESLSTRSPIPTEKRHIQMDGPLDLIMVMDVICENLVRTKAKLMYGTWKELFKLFKQPSSASNISRCIELGFEVLFIVSKADITEYKSLVMAADPSLTEVGAEKRFDNFFLEIIRASSRMVEKDISAFKLSGSDLAKARQFLDAPTIQHAMKTCLEHLSTCHDIGISCCPTDIASTLGLMELYVSDDLPDLDGIVIRSGVIFNRRSLDSFPSGSYRYDAFLCTLVLHESIHFLSRKLLNDFSFTSAVKYKSPGVGVKIFDQKIEDKGLEMGRHIELALFSLQPDWTRCNVLAAMLFLRRSLASSPHQLPLFNRFEAFFLLKPQPFACLSLGLRLSPDVFVNNPLRPIKFY